MLDALAIGNRLHGNTMSRIEPATGHKHLGQWDQVDKRYLYEERGGDLTCGDAIWWMV